jgi:hypothetical protein
VAEAAGFESVWVTERYFHEETFSLLGLLVRECNSCIELRFANGTDGGIIGMIPFATCDHSESTRPMLVSNKDTQK